MFIYMCCSSPFFLQLEYVDLFLIHFPISLACAAPAPPALPLPPPLPPSNPSCAIPNLYISFVPFEERYPPEWTFQKGAAMPDGQVFANVPIRCGADAVCVLHAHDDAVQ